MSEAITRSCPNCGRPVSERSRFCQGCGADLEEMSTLAEPRRRSSRRRPETGAASPVGEEAIPSFPQPVELLVPVRPDTNLIRALLRNTTRNSLSAGVAAALVAAAVVLAGTALIAVLFWIAHRQGGCTAQASFSMGACQDTVGANGFLTNWNAVLWSVQGVPVVIGASDGSTLTMRIPLATGILLVAAVLFWAGRLSVGFRQPRRPRDILIRALIIGLAYMLVMEVAGACITARGGGYAVGPDYGMLALWAAVLGFLASAAGVARRLFGASVPGVPTAALRARLGRFGATMQAAVVGSLLALALALVLGIVAMATHSGDTANIVRLASADITTKPFPDSVLGTLAALMYLALAGPTIAVWVLVYAMAIPTVSLGALQGATDFGLVAGSHDAYFWAVLALPVLASLLTGYAAARLRRAGTVESALAEGALGGLGLAAVLFVVIVLLDGAGSVTGGAFGGHAVSPTVPFGPGLEYTFYALLLFGVVGGAVGAYLSLLVVQRTLRLPLLCRYNIAVVGAPIIAEPRRCPACGRAVLPGSQFCSACGAALTAKPDSG